MNDFTTPPELPESTPQPQKEPTANEQTASAQAGTPQAAAATTPADLPQKKKRSRSELTWMIIAIAASSALLLGGITTFAVAQSGGFDRGRGHSDVRPLGGFPGKGSSDMDERMGGMQNSKGQRMEGRNNSDGPRNRPDVSSENSSPMSDADTKSASDAAIKAAGGKGTVTDIDDRSGSNSTYAFEVEVERPDGSEVTVYLDSNFKVVKTVEDGDFN